MEAEIWLQYSSAALAKSVKEAISPDNQLGEGMRISAMVKGRVLKVRMSNCKSIETIQATLQDIFRCMRAGESSLMKLVSTSKSSSSVYRLNTAEKVRC